MSEAAIPEDLKIKCVLCKGVGHKERTSFSSPGTLRMGSCHACKGTGKVWAFDQQQMAERIAAAEAQVADLQAQLSSTIQQHEAAAVEMRTKYEALEKERNALAHELGRHASIEDKAHLQTIDERDAAEECLSQMYYLITGNSPEWSNLFGHVEALQDADDAQRCLRAEVKALEKEVERLAWQPITPENLPTRGDEVTCWHDDDEPYHVYALNAEDDNNPDSYLHCVARGDTHFRPINAPIIAARAEPQKEPK